MFKKISKSLQEPDTLFHTLPVEKDHDAACADVGLF